METSSVSKDPIILKNLKFFYNSKRKEFKNSQHAIYNKGLTKDYVMRVIISLIANKRLSLSYSSKYWHYDGFIYKRLSNFINNDQILNKIAETKEFFSMLGPKFLRFDPLMQNIVYLPLSQQKIIIEKFIIHLTEKTATEKSYDNGTIEKLSFKELGTSRSSFQSGLLSILFDKHEEIIELLKTVTNCPYRKHRLITAKLLDFIPR